MAESYDHDHHRLRVRREPFEYGLLPLSLPHLTTTTSLKGVKEKLIQNSSFRSSTSGRRVNTAGIAESLQLVEEHARVILDVLASVLPDKDPLSRASSDDVDSMGADVDDLLLFLYIQTYKKLVPRPHKDAASVADVWPSTSAFDGFLATLSPLQLVRSGRRFMPSQADEEAHQLSYVQKHLPNILSLLAEPLENDSNEMQVLSLESFDHLDLLLHVGDISTETTALSQAAPFFANSDPDMPAVPVPTPQVLEWLLEHICAASEHPFEKVLGREKASPRAVDLESANLDSLNSSSRSFPNGPTQQMKNVHQELAFVEGVNKASIVKQASDIWAPSVKISEPLVRVLRLVESADKSPMGCLYEAMKKAKECIKSFCKKVTTKYMLPWQFIDRRWNGQFHKPIRATTYFLNPKYYYPNGSNFEADDEISSGLYLCLERMVGHDPQKVQQTQKELPMYRGAEGYLFSSIACVTSRESKIPAVWWESFGAKFPLLQQLAIRILSQPCSASGCEHNWSLFEQIHSKRRSRLVQERLNKLVYAHYNFNLKIRKIEGSDGEPISLDEIDPSNEWVRNDGGNEDECLEGDGLERLERHLENVIEEDYDLETQSQFEDIIGSSSAPPGSRAARAAAREKGKARKRAHY